MATTLDYASPATMRVTRQVEGLTVGAISFGLSVQSAIWSFSAAYFMRYPYYRDCFDMNGTTFWVYSPVLGGLAFGGLALCMKFGAGIVVARIGLIVAALMWLGSLLVYLS